MTNKKAVVILIVVFITCLTHFVLSAIRFALTDTTPFYWDSAYHIKTALNYYTALTNHNYLNIIVEYTRYPPLTHLGLALFLSAFGYSKLTIILFNITLLFMLLVSVFYFTKRTANTFVATVSSIFALGFLIHITQPYQFMQSLYDFMLDVPLVVSTFISYCFITHGIRKQSVNTASSLTIGISFGLAMLTKWTAFFLLCLPLLWYCRSLLVHKKYLTIGTVLAGIFAGGGWWYLLHFRFLLIQGTIVYQASQYYTSFTIMYFPMLISLIPMSLVWIIPSIPVLYLSILSIKKYSWKTVVAKIAHNMLTWEIINVIIAILIYCLLPIHDFRFLYSTLFLFGMIVFWSIIRHTTRLQLTLFTIGVCIYTTLAVWTVQPTISREKFVIDRLLQYSQTYSHMSLAVFFEDDSASFNPVNILLLNNENAVFHMNTTSQYQFINHATSRSVHECTMNESFDYLFVYTARADLQDLSNHRNFEQMCSSYFLNMYTLISSENYFDGTLRVFQKKLTDH